MQSVNPTLATIGTRYGHTRPAAIAAKVAALQTRCFPVALIAAIEAPKPAAPLAPVAAIPRAQIAQWQAERAQLLAELPTLRFYAVDAEFCSYGPTFAEVEAMESRLAILDDYLIFEPQFAAAETFNALLLAA